MTLKILHTGDLHIGMKFNKYPEDVREDLKDARINVLEKLVDVANEEQCQIFAIAGDLFDKISSIAKHDITKVIGLLDKFEGECILVLPGNHDYDNGMTTLWTTFREHLTHKMILLNENRSYHLGDYDVDAIIYPAYCNAKHSSENNLSWIKDLEERPEGQWHIGIGHGSLQGLSPDMKNTYFSMSEEELNGLGLDLWLLGHTHIPYPRAKEVAKHRIFNAGTPEPDGMDCKHGGNVWIISLDEGKKAAAKAVETGTFRFHDLTFQITEEKDFEKIKNEILLGTPSNKHVRLKLHGKIERDLFERKEDFYDDLRKEVKYLEIEDEKLGLRITKEDVESQFTKGSFPYQLLSNLSQDEEALQLAYELIMEVKE